MPPSGSSEPTVFLVEDDPGVRSSMGFDLRASGYRVCSYASAEDFLAAHAPGAQGCVIADVRLPGMDGVALQTELLRRGSHLAVIIVTGFADVPLAVRAMKAGAADFIEKPFHPGAVTEAVERALRAAPNRETLRDEASVVLQRMASLSEREREVLEGLVKGNPSKQIARELGISPRTVEIYRANAVTKLGAKSQADLIRKGLLAALYVETAPAGPSSNPATDVP